VKLLVGRTDLSNRPSTRSFTRSWSRHAACPLTCPSARLAKAHYLDACILQHRVERGRELSGPIADQESEQPNTLTEVYHEVASLQG
jgi:hypothetical protein